VDDGVRVFAPRPDQFISAEHHRLHATVAELITDLTSSGATAQRPVTRLYTGRFYFDTTLGLPIWYEGPGWVKADGTAA
jgi:hypothetical protein